MKRTYKILISIIVGFIFVGCFFPDTSENDQKNRYDRYDNTGFQEEGAYDSGLRLKRQQVKKSTETNNGDALINLRKNKKN